MMEDRAMHVDIQVLDNDSAMALLRRHHLGRLAVAHHDRIVVHVVNYVFANGWVYARLERGETFETLRHNPWITFEVDEVDGIYDWRAVMARGSVHFLDDPDASTTPVAPTVANAYREALRLLRDAVPALLTPADPVPERSHLYRIHVDELSGTHARSDASPVLPPA
jgi:nitroimidazol reductase NimA-like FMN-containing flavoprotein (pyridoxamine 5'-phosphate oxidase superfamily)